jgi:hypothetical protein
MPDLHTYDYWHAALDGQTNLAISQNHPQPGFYRMKNGRPVAIWFEDDVCHMMVGSDHMVPLEDYEDTWVRVCNRPVSEDQYNAVIAGGVWHDVDEVIRETLGDNIADANDPEAILTLIDMLRQAASNYSVIDSDEAVAKAQTIRTRALELKAKADKIREKEKAPHLAAGREVDAKWQPLVKGADSIVSQLRGAMERWETEKLRERRKQEELARLKDEANAPAPEPVKDTVRGGYGRGAHVGSKKVVIGVNDLQALFAYVCGEEEVMAVMLKLAQRAVDAGKDVPGVIVEEQAYVR